MSYIVLARKYRPQTFLELYAQDHVTTIIKNALETKRIAHAYLFTGPRGVGKTSLARILAKSLNCENGPTITPCNVCSNCTEITSGTSTDVVEIDGASNNGVDDIRDLQGELIYAPSNSKYKIYIIDEVHMLSTSAFNALLKTLEEPPENVVFIFATTEPHKVLPTIISRCQRFDFKRIPIEDIIRRLTDIVKSESISVDSESLYLIARKADGGMRDALSLMDQVISYCANNVTIDRVREIFGILPVQAYNSLFVQIANHQPGALIVELQNIFDRGVDVGETINELLEFCRIVLLQKLNVKTAEISPDELPVYRELVPAFSVDDLLYIISSLVQVKREIKTSSNPYFILEVALIKLSKMDSMQDLAKVLETIKSGDYVPSVSMASVNVASKPLSTSSNTATKAHETEHEPEVLIKTTFSEENLKANWHRILARLRKLSQFASTALAAAKIEKVSDDSLIIKPGNQSGYQLLQKALPKLTEIFKELFNADIKISLSEADKVESIAPKQSSLNEILEANPMISRLAEITNSTIEPG